MRLPEEIRREVNRLAYALAQNSFAEHRRNLEAQARALIRAGSKLDDVLARLGTPPDEHCEQYAQARTLAREGGPNNIQHPGDAARLLKA